MMSRSRLAEATVIGCLTALASFCALNARAGETYSIVAQSTRSSAATGRRPLSERIAAANLPIITHAAATPPQGVVQRGDAVPAEATASPENMAVAAVRVDQAAEASPAPPTVTPPVLWPFGTKWMATTAQRSKPAAQPVATGKPTAIKGQAATASKGQSQQAVKHPAAAHAGQRQASARSSGKGLSGSSPASVTR